MRKAVLVSALILIQLLFLSIRCSVLWFCDSGSRNLCSIGLVSNSEYGLDMEMLTWNNP